MRGLDVRYMGSYRAFCRDARKAMTVMSMLLLLPFAILIMDPGASPEALLVIFAGAMSFPAFLRLGEVGASRLLARQGAPRRSDMALAATPVVAAIVLVLTFAVAS